MAVPAEGLPVVFIPEQLLIAPVRYNMIDYRCRGQFVLLQALHTQRMQLQVPFPGSAPPGIISSGIRTTAQPVAAPGHVLLTKYLTLLAEARTSGITARPFRFIRHIPS